MTPIPLLKERLIEVLQACRELLAPDHDITPEERAQVTRQVRVALSVLKRKPRYIRDPQGLLDENEEIAIHLADGSTIYSGWIDKDDPDALVSGDYLRLEGPDGKEVLYYGADEIMDDYQLEGRRALGAFLNACAGLRNPEP